MVALIRCCCGSYTSGHGKRDRCPHSAVLRFLRKFFAREYSDRRIGKLRLDIFNSEIRRLPTIVIDSNAERQAAVIQWQRRYLDHAILQLQIDCRHAALIPHGLLTYLDRLDDPFVSRRCRNRYTE